jgi:type IV pilus biogenesis protein CpaD/CtpE
MSVRSPRRRLAATGFVGVMTLVLAACSGAAASPPASVVPVSPSASAPAQVAPTQAIDVDELLGAAGANDGKLVRVTGNFLADDQTAQLCAVMLESYPPQCGGGVRLTGQVTGDTLAMLTTTTEPNIKKMWWGYVVVTGTFRASGVDGQPTIELGEVILEEG